ncbi:MULTISPECIES: anion permease [Furfurilactobacillus]|uniref:Anion permease n=1 Tax=Furfurilactobacillus milii TaxID=2888272 RepID=A0ABT6D9M9_9LACO|nr:anion permease [Furfurilactobacillus milii]QLE65527.1 2-oxoglutarate translocator [Furfurilactobacillus rossiae]MCF6161203.1 anion permease [Furfurilactobacillus milii]MCF6163542.1 anion permease [Furfurilactobacillus milii]MDF9913829.1 anion permease [Furfurilactobacillus milii]QLE67957.1 2-oxoglutarate translocator [Furfurilactobacillus rossiae]
MKLENVKYKNFLWPVLVGLIIWFLAPIRPDAVSLAAWHMLAIFVGTIIACITQPIAIGGVALIGVTLTVLLGIVPMKDATTAFGNNTVWLIAMAYFLSRGFIKTGFGRRVALIFVRLFGKRTLGLAYSLVGVDLVTAPATPSNTARAGGIIFPIIESLATTFGSHPKDGTERKIGSFLVYTEFQGDIITSAMFLTAMAPNLVAVAMAGKAGVHITWISWFLAALVPGIISLICVPYIIYKLYPPEVKETPNAKDWADKELADMGPMSTPEKIMMSVFLIALLLWIASSFIGLDATLVAFIAVSLLLLTGVLSVQDILKETGAWNTLIWFSILIFMANELTQLGLIKWLSSSIGTALHGVSWMMVLVILFIFYFYTHYLFASGTAHVTAMYAALLAVALAAGVPHMLAAIMLAFAGPLFSSTTHYASGPATVLFGSGFVKQSDWWRLNAILGVFYIVVWLGGGLLWTKVLGMW